MTRIIVRNAVRCQGCGDTIESTYTHDYLHCTCAAIAVDGGHDYIRRVHLRSDVAFTELTEYLDAPDDDDTETIPPRAQGPAGGIPQTGPGESADRPTGPPPAPTPLAQVPPAVLDVLDDVAAFAELIAAVDLVLETATFSWPPSEPIDRLRAARSQINRRAAEFASRRRADPAPDGNPEP